MNVEYVSVQAPEHCARCMGPPSQSFEIQVGKNPKRADNLVKFTVSLCDDCRARMRTSLAALLVPGIGFIVFGIIWSLFTDSVAPILLAAVAAIVTILVTGPMYRQAHPLILDDGPVRFRNEPYNDLFAAHNTAFLKQLNAARREAITPPRGELSPLLQSILRGGVYVGLFATVVGFRAPATLFGGIVLALTCGGVLVTFSRK